MMHVLSSLLLAAAFASAPPANAQDPAAKGMTIAKATENKDDGFKSYRGVAKMILKDRSGGTNVRDFTATSVEAAPGTRTILAFQSPGDVKGVSLLTHTAEAGSDDQWLYMPANGRVRRIAGSGRQGSFVGSEFSYEDLMGVNTETNTFRWVKDEPCPGALTRACYVNEQIPKSPDSGYSRIVGWIDKQDYRMFKAEYYDRSNALTKTLNFGDFKQFEGRYWRSMKMEMINHLTGKSTTMEWSDFDYGVAVNADELQPFNMNR